MIPPKYNARVECHVLIPMRDGISLFADVIRRDSEGRFPVLVECHPNRKDDASRSGYGAHPYLAERGFVGIRLNVRSKGGSERVCTYEYTRQEQQDGYNSIEWLAGQPWSKDTFSKVAAIRTMGARCRSQARTRICLESPESIESQVQVLVGGISNHLGTPGD